MKYRVQIGDLPAEEFGPESQLQITGTVDELPQDDPRPWDQERAWDCYKRKHPKARELRRSMEPKIEEAFPLADLPPFTVNIDDVQARLKTIHTPPK